MKHYKLKTLLRQTVQWFKGLFSLKVRLMNLNKDALIEAQNKCFERLVYHKGDAVFQIIDDLVFVSYQLELIGVNQVPHTDAQGFARHLGRVDSLFQLVRIFNDLKQAEVQKAIVREKEERRVRTFGTSRPVI